LLKTVAYYPHLVSANIREIRNVVQRFVGSIRQKPGDIVQENLAQHWQQLSKAADKDVLVTTKCNNLHNYLVSFTLPAVNIYRDLC
jgi:hypothetical protein